MVRFCRPIPHLRLTCALGVLAASSAPALAGGADVIGVTFERNGDSMAFEVTIRHADEGWDHYADRFEIVGLDGTVYSIRKLTHPHVEEQPFTRTIGGVRLPTSIGGEVIVRARDSVHGFSGQEFVVKTKKAYACGVPVDSGIKPPTPEPVSGRAQCPLYPPGQPTGVEGLE